MARAVDRSPRGYEPLLVQAGVVMRRLAAGQGCHDVGAAVGLRGEQADHQREAHIIPSPHRVQERLVGGNKDAQAVKRVAGDGPRVGAVGDGELGAGWCAVEELAGVGGDGSAEIADPVGQVAGRCARVLGDLGEFVAEQVDGRAFETVGDCVRPQAGHDVVAVKAVEVIDHIVGGAVRAGHGRPFLALLVAGVRSLAGGGAAWLRGTG
jgi:hypothetical protein